jgi:hypothetical protein
MKQLAKAVLAVMDEVKGVEKNMTVGAGQNTYKGVSDKDVKLAIGRAMQKHGLCLMPIGVEESAQVDRWEAVDPWSKSTPKETKWYQSVFTKVTTKYLLLHESGESIELASYGHGVDPQDKGAGKATTYALKNLLLYMFLVPTGTIDDTDTTHSDNIPTPPPATVAPVRPAQSLSEIAAKPASDVAPLAAIKSAKTLPELAAVWKSLTQAEQKLPTVTAAKDARKNELTPQP